MNLNKSRIKNKYMMTQNKKKQFNTTNNLSIKNLSINDQSINDPSINDPSINTPNNISITNPKSLNKYENTINKYVKNLVRSESDTINPDLKQSIKLLTAGAYYYPHCVCDEKDLNLFKQIIDELEQAGELKIVEWSQHCKIENPRCSITFNDIIEKIAKIFNVTVCETRLNYYKDQSDWKPLHHDSHAYNDQSHLREDFTIGISLGSTRELVFMHEQSGNKFKFPQKNGDVFAFDKHVNKNFLHGVTKSFVPSGPRISLIAWCKSHCDVNMINCD